MGKQEKVEFPADEGSASIMGVAARDIMRLKALVSIITRHGFGEIFQRSPLGKFLFNKVDLGGEKGEGGMAPPAVRFRRLLESLGPTYIKFGQILSMRPDVLPPQYIDALMGLQDQAPVVPITHIRERIRRGLGKPVEEVYAEFDDTPLATASIGQTHRALTRDGHQVVVKVQRPGIEQVMRGDLDLLFMLAKMLEAGIEEIQLLQPSEIVAEFEKALVRELDFNQELNNLLTATKFLQPERAVMVPKPYPELSCRTVLTMEYFPGKSIRHLAINSDLARHAATELMHTALQQIFFDGFFHGDPHAGNILINDAGQLCLLDFGLVGRLSEEQQADVVSLIFAIVTRDAAAITHLLLRMGTPTTRVNIAELRAEVARLLQTYLGVTQLSKFNSQEFANEFVAAAQRFRIKLAPEYTILIKATSTFEGVIRGLNPDLDIVAIATPYVQRVMAKRYSPKNLLAESFGGLAGLGGLLRQLPNQLEQIMHDAETGNIQVRAITPQLDAVVPLLHQLGSRLALAAFASTMTMAAALLIALSSPERPHAVAIGVTTGVAASAWLGLWSTHFFGRGRPFRARTVLQFFKR